MYLTRCSFAGFVFAIGLVPVLGATSTRAGEAGDEDQGRAEGIRAAEPEVELRPRHRLSYSNLILVRLNPLGLEDWIDLGYRYRLYQHESPLFRDNHLGLAFTPTISPAVARIGGAAELRPLSILSLSAGYYFVSWFGTFDYLQSYPAAQAAYSDTALEAGTDAGQNYATTGSELHLRAQPIVKLGSVVVRDELSFYYFRTDLRGDDRVYYHIRLDALVPNEAWALTNDTDLLYLFDFGLVAGLRSTVTHSFFRDRDFIAGQPRGQEITPTWRLGPLLAYIFSQDLSIGFNKPTVLLIANWWLKHRYRTGADVHQAVPYLVLAFKFEGDIWRTKY